MATGYTISFSKITGDTIEADDFNNEYQAIDNAFSHTTGHAHDGTTDGGAYVPLIASADTYNKVVVNDTDNTLDFYVDVASAAVQQIEIADGAIYPVTNNDVDLGIVTTNEFKNLYIDGIAYIDTLQGGALSATAGVEVSGGNVTLNDNQNLYLGTSDDLVLKHDGVDSYIINQNTGTLYIENRNLQGLIDFKTDDTIGDPVLCARMGGLEPYVILYFDGSARLTTTTGGVSVTGDITVTGTVDGVDVAALSSNYTSHAGGTGADHTYIDQNVTTTGTPTFGSVTVDNIIVNGNTISTSTGSINLTPNAGGQVVLDTSVYVDGGIVTASNGTFKTVSGSDSLELDGTSLISTNTNQDIDITPNGSGKVVIPGNGATIGSMSISTNSISNSTTSISITPAAGFPLVLDTSVTIDGGAVDITGDLDVDNININGNTIISTDTNGDINITPNGTGTVSITDLTVTSAATMTGIAISAGDVTSSGDFIVSTGDSGNGVDFSANTGLAGETSSVLDWYEEGTFTFELADATTGGNTFTMATADGWYTRIGRQVTIHCEASTTSASGTSGNCYLRGLPWAPAVLMGNQTSSQVTGNVDNPTTATGALYFVPTPGQTYGVFKGADSGSDTILQCITHITGGQAFSFNMTYMI